TTPATPGASPRSRGRAPAPTGAAPDGRCRCPGDRCRWASHTQPIAVAVPVVAGVLVTARRGAELAQDDHAGGAPVDAQSAASALVLVDHEHDFVIGVGAGLDDAL